MSRFQFPHPLVLLTACILLAALASYVLPAGQYDRRDDPVTDRSVVVPGTFHRVDANPVGPFQAVVSIPLGLADAASVVFLVFLVGGAFAVVDETGALGGAVAWLIARLGSRELLVIPVVSLVFALGGVLENMQEEIIPLIPVLILLTRRMGFDPLVAVSMSAGSAFVGSAFSPINPFQVGIAQKLAELPLLSGAAYRIAFLLPALAVWIGWTMRYAHLNRVERDHSEELIAKSDERHAAIVPTVIVSFTILVVGLLRWGWGFDEISALFLIMGVLAGLMGRLGITGTATAFVNGFRSMAFAALLIGFARAIFVVLDQGRIVDTIVNGLVAPLTDLPVLMSALGMIGIHAAVHIPVPSVSGHAVLTMPVLVPMSDLLGLSRQVTVLAYQYGAGLCDLMTPTNGALMAILAVGGVRYERWIRFAAPLYLTLVALGGISVAVAIAIGLQ